MDDHTMLGIIIGIQTAGLIIGFSWLGVHLQRGFREMVKTTETMETTLERRNAP